MGWDLEDRQQVGEGIIPPQGGAEAWQGVGGKGGPTCVLGGLWVWVEPRPAAPKAELLLGGEGSVRDPEPTLDLPAP